MQTADGTKEDFTFARLDELLLVPPQRFARAHELAFQRLHPRRLGPLIEYVFHRDTTLKHLPDPFTFPDGQITSAVLTRCRQNPADRSPSSTSLESRDVELATCATSEEEAACPLWTAFWKRVDRAAESAGFSPKTAAGLSAAVQEVVDNVHLHSGRPETGLVGYRWCAGEFEFVVADAGIGILNSLRQCPEFDGLGDYGTALKLALSGRSRFGTGSGHGQGFRQVFVALTDLYGSLRFRSGDHALELDGNSPSLPVARLLQRRNYTGFIIAVVCRPVFLKNSPS
ncbi:MAG: hypothetical protein ABSE73_01140 [Planctomycetota bacterium]